MADALETVRKSVWEPLFQQMKDARTGPAHTAAVDLLARPVELLRLMGCEAAAALADDVLAADRLRMFLFLAEPFASHVEEAQRLAKADPVKPGQYDPSVIDHAALPVLAVAAMRVAPEGRADTFARTVHGLALAATPAEVLGRLHPQTPGRDAISVIVDTLYLLDGLQDLPPNSRLRPFAADPAERARWVCLRHLFEADLPAAIDEAHREIASYLDWKKLLPWDGGDSSPIEEVSWTAGAPPELSLRGRFESIVSGSALRPGVCVVVEAEGSDEPALRCEVIEASETRLRVRLPRPVLRGWIGFSWDQRLQRANRFREALRYWLPRKVERLGCVRGVEDLIGLIRDVGVPDPLRPGERLARPPRTPSNRFEAAAGTVATFSRKEVVGHPPSPAPRAAAAGTRDVHIASVRVLQGEREERFFLKQPLDVDVLLDAPGSKVAVMVDGKEDDALVEEARTPQQRFTVSIPEDRCHDGMSLTVRVDGSDDRRARGPLTLGAPREARIVLVRPQVVSAAWKADDLPDVERRQWLHSLIRYVGEQLGLKVRIEELPWIDDDLAVLTSRIDSVDDARIPLLLEALARRAMFSPGLESAAWICVPPLGKPAKPVAHDNSGNLKFAKSVVRRALKAASPERGRATAAAPPLDERRRANAVFKSAVEEGHAFQRFEPAEAARAVAVATWPALPHLLGRLYAEDAQPACVGSTPRVRLVGRIENDSVVLESVQEELKPRARGKGASLDSPFNVVTLDADGRELLFTPLKCMRAERPALLAALPPISRSVAAIEIRKGRKEVVARVRRVNDGGKEHKAQVEAQVEGELGAANQSLRWSYRHPQNARPALALALFEGPGREKYSTEVERFDACEPSPLVHLCRYGSADGIELLASDGWNCVSESVRPTALVNPDPVAIRRLPDGRWFADIRTEKTGTIEWRLRAGKRGDEEGDDVRGRDRVLDLPAGEQGILRLTVTLEGHAIVDERPVPEA